MTLEECFLSKMADPSMTYSSQFLIKITKIYSLPKNKYDKILNLAEVK